MGGQVVGNLGAYKRLHRRWWLGWSNRERRRKANCCFTEQSKRTAWRLRFAQLFLTNYSSMSIELQRSCGSEESGRRKDIDENGPGEKAATGFRSRRSRTQGAFVWFWQGLGDISNSRRDEASNRDSPILRASQEDLRIEACRPHRARPRKAIWEQQERWPQNCVSLPSRVNQGQLRPLIPHHVNRRSIRLATCDAQGDLLVRNL